MKNLLTKLIESDGFLIARIGSESNKRFVESLSKWDIGMYQQAVLTTLIELTEHGTTSQKELGDLTGIDPRNLVPIIDSLEERGFVERLTHPNDRRRSTINLTQEGKLLARQIRKSGEELERDMFSCLSDKEKDILHKVLLKLYYAIDTKGEKNES